MRVRVSIRAYIILDVFLRVRVYVCMYVRQYEQAYIIVKGFLGMEAFCMCVCTSIHTLMYEATRYKYEHTHMYVCMYVCTYTHAHLHVDTKCTQTHAFIHSFTRSHSQTCKHIHAYHAREALEYTRMYT